MILIGYDISTGHEQGKTWAPPQVAPLKACSDSAVPRGLGALEGWTPVQHYEWARGLQEHPCAHSFVPLVPEVVEVSHKLSGMELKDIDQFRAGAIKHWISVAKALQPECCRWLSVVSQDLKQMLAPIHGPPVSNFCKRCSITNLGEPMQNGFSFAGVLPFLSID